ncbi:hypothetical protein [Streptomyces sp. NPDC051000]|uniref:hypothetical protein n=1 Tax=unclassified Streptomyces TaxID=2593676 RepID=UPI0033CDC537
MPQAGSNKTNSSRDMGIDLGAANTLVEARGHGIVLTGGGALLPGLDLRMASATGRP